MTKETEPDGVRVKGSGLFMAVQSAMAGTLLFIAFKAGGVDTKLSQHDMMIVALSTQIGDVNKTVALLGRIASANAEGNLNDRASLSDVRERLRMLEGGPK